MRTVERWRPFRLVVRTFIAAMISHQRSISRLSSEQGLAIVVSPAWVDANGSGGSPSARGIRVEDAGDEFEPIVHPRRDPMHLAHKRAGAATNHPQPDTLCLSHHAVPCSKPSTRQLPPHPPHSARNRQMHARPPE